MGQGSFTRPSCPSRGRGSLLTATSPALGELNQLTRAKNLFCFAFVSP